MKGKTDQSSDYLIFRELIYEYNDSVRNDVEKKIKRKLKYYSLGPYNQTQVDYIRSLMQALQREIYLFRDSKYFKKTPSVYAEIEDFNISQMVKDYAPVYDRINIDDLRDMIGWAVHMLHTR